MSSLMDFWHSVLSVYGSADMITLGIVLVIVIAAGVIMQGFEALVTTTVVALILFGLAGYARAVVLNGQNAAQLAEVQWHGFLGMTMQTLLAYAVTFAAGIGLIHVVRSFLTR